MANDWNADLFISIHCNSAENKSATGTETYVYSKKSKSHDLAKNIAEAISKDLSLKNRGVIENPSLVVLRTTKMPALLVETAFICNASDAQKLRDRQDDFAESVFGEICAYYGIESAPYTYRIEGTTHIIEVSPRDICSVETQCKTKKVQLRWQ
jgi:N-acetylmuramoyl-L-alanine amidase